MTKQDFVAVYCWTFGAAPETVRIIERYDLADGAGIALFRPYCTRRKLRGTSLWYNLESNLEKNFYHHREQQRDMRDARI